MEHTFFLLSRQALHFSLPNEPYGLFPLITLVVSLPSACTQVARIQFDYMDPSGLDKYVLERKQMFEDRRLLGSLLGSLVSSGKQLNGEGARGKGPIYLSGIRT